MLNEPESLNTQLTHLECMGDAEKYLAEHAVDIILLDLGLPDAQGLEAVRAPMRAAPHIPLVVLTGLDDERVAAQALQEGAQDYLIKGQIETRGLMRALRYAGERKIMEEALFEEKERAQVTLNSIGRCRHLHGHFGRYHLPQRRRGENDGLALAGSGGRPMIEVFRVLTPRATESGPNPVENPRARDPIVHLPSNCILIRATGSKFRSKTPSPPFIIAKGATGSGGCFPRCERRPGNGAANRPFGRARFSDRVAQSDAPE
jgi:CheY-like chemotaxis protein